MSAYGFTDQQIANALQEQGLYTPAGSGSTQPEQVTGIINQQLQTGGGDGIGMPGGIGAFGNLDPSTKKTMQVEYNGQEMEVGFNVSYLLDILGVIPDSQVRIDFI